MIGCHAWAVDSAVTVDTTELEDARWFTRAEVKESVEAVDRGGSGQAFGAPPRSAVANALLRWWVARR
jgi:NAD+ diphosphatase